MSLDATRWAWQQQIKPATAKLVLLSLADRAGEAHECHPSIRRLQFDTSLDRETIMRAITTLEAAGILRVIRKHGAGSSYQLLGVQDRDQSAKPYQSANADQSGNADRHQSANADSNQSANADSEPTSEPISEPYTPPTPPKPQKQPKAAKPKPEGITLPDWLLETDWQAFLAHRKASKAAMTAIAQSRAIAELERLRNAGNDPAEVINQSIINGWKGLFPIKSGYRANNPRRSIHDDRAATIEALTGRNSDGRVIEGSAAPVD